MTSLTLRDRVDVSQLAAREAGGITVFVRHPAPQSLTKTKQNKNRPSRSQVTAGTGTWLKSEDSDVSQMLSLDSLSPWLPPNPLPSCKGQVIQGHLTRLPAAWPLPRPGVPHVPIFQPSLAPQTFAQNDSHWPVSGLTKPQNLCPAFAHRNHPIKTGPL